MTVDLARRLLDGAILPRAEVEDLLLLALSRGVALLRVLESRSPAARATVERELARWPGPTMDPVHADFAHAQRLPMGMCEWFLAVPVGLDESAHNAVVAAVDPYDAALAAEFGYHLNVPVLIVRATLDSMHQALTALRSSMHATGSTLLPEAGEERTPAFGSYVPEGLRRSSARVGQEITTNSRVNRGFSLPPLRAPESQSGPPIPLVRAHGNVRAGQPSNPTQSVGVLAALGEWPATHSDRGPELNSAQPSREPPGSTSRESVAALSLVPESEAVKLALTSAITARHVVDVLCDGLQSVARSVACFALRGGEFVLQAASNAGARLGASFSSEEPSPLNTACQAGYFLGLLPSGQPSNVLCNALGIGPDEEVYAVPAHVAGRPALVVVASRFDNTFAATRWIDPLVLRAGDALSRILNHRRRQH